MNTFDRSIFVTTSSRLALAMTLAAFGSGTAFGQTTTGTESAQQAEETAPAADAAPAAEDDAIVVTGFRNSLQKAVGTKKRADQVVESISAEDIGKLPDASIAESIARLPGLTSQRVSGRSNVISIRGFSPDFSTTLLNGREQTSTGDNRAVEYDQYPSEIINQVNVYKTPMASIVGQGLSGTVDLRTIRPLSLGKRILSIGARGSIADIGKLNSGSTDKGWRVNGVWGETFADGRAGFVIAASYLDEPYQISEFNAWGYPTVDVCDGRYGQVVASGGTLCGDGNRRTPRPGYENAVGKYVIGGSKSYNTSTELKRLGLQGSFDFQPTDEFTTSLDVFYSNFKDDQIKRGIELPLYWSGATLAPNPTVEGDFITDGAFTGVKGVLRNDGFQRHAKLFSIGWNNKYQNNDGLTISTDVSYSNTKRNELVLETYSGTGRNSVGATDTIGFSNGNEGTTFDPGLNYGDYGLILLTSPQGWGGNQTAVNGTRIINGQDGYYNDRIIKDTIWQVRADAIKEFDNSFLRSIQAGINYTDRSKSLIPDEYFLGLAANTDGTVSVPIPVDARLDPTNLLFGLGPLVSYDPFELVDSGIYNLVANPYGDVVVKSYSVKEQIFTPYIQANIRKDIGTSELTGNIGVQANFTKQISRGASATYLGTNPNGSPNIGTTVNTFEETYVDILPSLNLSLRTASDFVIRFAAAREIIRPRMDDMRYSLSYGYNNVTVGGQQIAFVSGGSGNPALRPWRANAVDLTFEKYWGTKGYVAAQFFWKDLRSYIYNQDVLIPTADLVLAPPQPGYTLSEFATLNIPVNGSGGKLYGVELAGTLPFETFSTALTGFGLTGGVSYTKTKVQPTPGAPAEDLPGYSKWVANGTAFYERYGFNIRASVRHRSTFVGEVSGFGANRVRRRAQPETILDGQIGYEFQKGSALEGLSVYVQGQNLTDEPFVTTNPGDDRQIIDYQKYGRRFLAGFTYKF